MDEYVRIGETTTIKSMKFFVKAVILIFGDEYLRSLNSNDIARLLTVGEKQGFPELAEGHAPKVNYSINGHDYTMGYYLADGIYPAWSTFVKTIPTPQGRKRQLFALTQESTRKDVKRAFGVLQARFAIVRGPTRYFCQSVLKDIMMACIILHNMIVEDERDSYLRAHDFDYDQEDDTNLEPISRYPTSQFVDFLQCHHGIRNKETHSQLQVDLIEHQWMLRGEE
ncbi:uncharacterized protein LOC122048440 [Zingiber officinale]|uniref:uncharacterized protein LOC122048440 n=1 Tax=Zingiber officinale TaxID=94328 RepID=UPI001C4C4319|nr:uncharacterized protein LOC122048440 [Zingiber officinale]